MRQIMLPILFLLAFSGLVLAQSNQQPFNPMDSMLQGQQMWNNMDRARQNAPQSSQPYRPSPPPSSLQPQPPVDLNQQGYDLLMQQYLQRQQLEHNHRLQRGGQ